MSSEPAEAVSGSRIGYFDATFIEEFAQRGFAVLKDVCDPSEVRDIQRILQDLFDRRAGFAEGNFLDMIGVEDETVDLVQPEILRTSFYAPRLRRSKYFRQINEIAKRILGPDAQFAFDHAILKPANNNAATPWHQDLAYRRDPNFVYEQITFWLPLQDAAIENGCMRYLPGSHRSGLREHRNVNGDDRVHSVECTLDSDELCDARIVPVRAGDAIVHHGLIVHSALPNLAETPRLALSFAFEKPPLPLKKGTRERAPWLERRDTAHSRRASQWWWRGGIAIQLLREIRFGLLTDRKRLAFEFSRARNELSARLNKWRTSR